jgi:hypothetical protein
VTILRSRRTRPAASLLAVLTALAAPAFAQWSSDPAANLVLADRSNEQVQPKLVATADGGFYVSWFDNADGGYDVRLQRLDANGVEQWPHNGVLVADRSFSSTQDYGLAIDSAGHALLAFRQDLGAGGVQAVLARWSPAGTPAWPAPLPVSAEATGANTPRVAGTDDGGIVVAWSAGDGAIGVHKLDGTGAAAWPQAARLLPPAGFFLLADLRAATAGTAILAWQAQQSQNNRQYWTQKLAATDGAPLWGGGQPVVLFDNSAGAMPLGYFPRHQHDGAGGAVFAWQFATGVRGEVAVQRVDAAGTRAFAANGVRVSTDVSRNRYAPAAAFDPVLGEVYLIWRETSSNQAQVGVYGQRIDASGARGWGEQGRVLVPVAAGSDRTQLSALPMADGALFAWAEGSFPQPMPIRASRVDRDGEPLWSPALATVKSAPTDGSRLTGELSVDGYAAYVWQDAAGSFNGDIVAQNLRLDGRLGPADPIFGNGFEPPPTAPGR